MKKMKFLGLLSSMMLAGAMMSATAAESDAGRVMDDSAITTKVKAAMVADKNVSGLKVHVKTYKGEVQLNGHVKTDAEKAAAESVASGVEGVTKVKNNLVVGEVHRSAGKAVDDAEVTTKVKAAFMGSPAVKSSQVSVTTKNGVVTLSGFVDSADAKSEAERVAHQVEDVHSVKNNLEVRQ